MIKYGLLHNHTDHSLRDGAMSVSELVLTAKEENAPMVELTDHGNMSAYTEFLSSCEENDIKPLIGVEAYLEEEGEGRKHFIISALDYTGFKALIKAVSESYERVDSSGYPRMNDDILNRNFGKKSSGYGHVIARTACIAGPLAYIILRNCELEKEIEKLSTKQEKFESPSSKGYLSNEKALNELLNAQKENADKLRKLKADLKKVSTRDSVDPKEIDSLEKEKLNIKDKIDRLKPIFQSQQKSVLKWQKLEDEINSLRDSFLSEDAIDEEVYKKALYYKNLFGDDNFYIEIQYHGMEEEKLVMPKLVEIANRCDIKTVLANDAHIATNKSEDILRRSIIKSMKYLNKYETPNSVDKEVYIKSDDKLVEKVSEIIPKEIALKSLENIKEITDRCNLVIPKENHYPAFTTPDGSSNRDYLKKMIDIGRKEKCPKRGEENYKLYVDRLNHEFKVIEDMGYIDYHLIVQDFLRYARCVGKLDLTDEKEKELALTFDTDKIERKVKDRVGEYVGPGRGSAAGSLICYCLGITNLDPIKNGLLFERK